MRFADAPVLSNTFVQLRPLSVEHHHELVDAELDCIAVEFRTNWHNRQSRAALAKLGTKQDGVLRDHAVLDDGTVRDTVVFSIIDREWPTVRHGLRERLGLRA